MELGQYQLQVFVSLVVILGAACVALICDFLKGNNEQLRELTIELKVRREEERKRYQLLMPQAAESAASPAACAPPPPKQRSIAAGEKKRTVNSDALAAMERGAALAGSGHRPRPAPAPAAPEDTPEVIVVAQQQPVQSHAASNLKKDWGSLLSRNAQAQKHEGLLAAVVDATNDSTSAQAAELSLPAGFQDGFVLTKLAQSHQPISGLVVSVGVSAARKSDGTLPEPVGQLIGSLIGPNDFAAQAGEDEFLLIYPEERGASAQRRLSEIAQQLWDFQLRCLGTFEILFSWGGLEVRSESIDEAIASASERMQETKRGRKLLTMASPAPAANTGAQLRQAV